MKKIFPLSVIFCLVFITLTLFYFIFLSPMMTDNFLFSRDMRPGYAAFYSGAPIASLEPMTIRAAFRQAVEMYLTWCGRFTGNLMVYMLFMLPHWLYSLIAAIGFGIYTLLLQMCVFGTSWRQNLSPGWLLGLAALLWAGLPSFGSAFFWLSVGGEIALIGQAAILLPFRFALDRLDAPARDAGKTLQCLNRALFFLAALFVASLDYPTSAALPPTAAACSLWLYCRQPKTARRLPAIPLAGTLGLCLGAALTLLAPGNAERLRLTNDLSVHAYMASSWGERIGSWLLHLPEAALMQIVPLAFLLWGCLALWGHFGKSWPRHVPQAAWLFLLPAALTHGAYLFTAWPPPRAFATTCAQLIICAGIVFTAARPTVSRRQWRHFSFLRLLLVFFCCGSILHEGIRFFHVNEALEQRHAIYRESGHGDATVPPLPVKGDSYMVLGSHLGDISTDPDYWVNRAEAAWHGLKSTRVALYAKEICHFSPDKDWAPRLGSIALAGDRFIISGIDLENTNGAKQVHVYYYGGPALLNKLPEIMAQKIYAWLGSSEMAASGSWLIPLLLARADIALTPDGAGKLNGMGRLNGLRANAGSEPHSLWLVTPGEGKYSFSLLPLHSSFQE